jgi:hypothetical protein
MTKVTDTNPDTIIDLDADQVIEHEDTPKSSEPIAPKPVKPHKSRWPLGVAALLAAAVGGGWVYKDFLSDYFPSDQIIALSEKVAVLDGQNTALREQFTNIDKLAAQLKSDIDGLEGKEQTLAGLAETAQKTDAETAQKLIDLEAALAETKQSLADLAARPVTNATGLPVSDAALQQRVASLEKDVASLKVKPAEAPDNTAALSQNLSDLKAKIAAGTGYRDEYDRIQRMVPAAEGLEVLSQHAALGVPDARGLAGELKSLIADLPKPIIPGPVAESEGWWAGIYRSLSDLITIKVEGDVDWPTTASAAVAFAETGDLPQAIEHLNSVEATKPVGVQQWLDRAQARLGIENALQSVEEAVLRVIAAKG